MLMSIAVRQSEKFNSSGIDGKSTFPLQECQWFEKQSYNIALTYLKTWPSKHAIDLMQYSTQVSTSEVGLLR